MYEGYVENKNSSTRYNETNIPYAKVAHGMDVAMSVTSGKIVPYRVSRGRT
jgi:hypothetical protein